MREVAPGLRGIGDKGQSFMRPPHSPAFKDEVWELLSAGTDDPLLLAKRIHDWIALNIQCD